MPTDFEILPMTMGHYDQVLELWNRTAGVMLVDTDTPEKAPAYFQRNPGLSHVALSNGNVIAAALCGHDGRRGYLHHLAVDANHRGQGIGRSVVDACLSTLQAADITACNLFIFKSNDEGKEFWRKGDWEIWPDLQIMTKRLDGYSVADPSG